MSEQEACFTFEAAVEMGITMEEETFRNYLAAIRTVKDKNARQILREEALDELDHKHQLEKALVEGTMDNPEGMRRPVQTMNLGAMLSKKELHAGSTAQDVLVYAIQLEKGSIDFYQRMAAGCGEAPMASLFHRLLADESRHLQSLEDMYEEHFMTQG